MLKKIIKDCAPKPVLRIIMKLYGAMIYRTSVKYVAPFRGTKALYCTIAYNKFGAYCLPKRSIDRPAAQATLRGKVWEEETIQFIIKNCKGGDIIHAGTYFGDFLPALSINCDLQAKIWAFEPVEEHYDCASVTMLLNKIKNVNLSNFGLGDKNGSYQMIVGDKCGRVLGGGSTVITNQEDLSSGSFESVDVIRLDEYIPNDRSISLMHLDIEGFEQNALNGAMSIIKRNFPLLILETLPENDWLQANLFSIGYEVEGKILDNTVLKHNGKA